VTKPKRRSITPRESETVPPVLAWLALQGIRVHRRNVGLIRQEYKGKSRWVRFAEPGMCDYWFILPDGSGRHIEMEWKRPGAWPGVAQIAWMLSVNARGGVAFWARDLTTVEFVVTSLLRGDRLYQCTDGRYELRPGNAEDCMQHHRRALAEFGVKLLADRRTSPALRKQIQELMT
jgi:hypothetical protein